MFHCENRIILRETEESCNCGELQQEKFSKVDFSMLAFFKRPLIQFVRPTGSLLTYVALTILYILLFYYSEFKLAVFEMLHFRISVAQNQS